MRVIAGQVRGRPLFGPTGSRTRPTSDLVKGALFSILETLLAAKRPGASSPPAAEPGNPENWSGLNVADLYAGTGALGIEALSRGAEWCDFVESYPGARAVIDRNLRVTGLSDRARLFGVDVRRVIHGVGREALHLPYSVVLLDPPYRDPSVESIIADLAEARMLEGNALVGVEHARDVSLAEAYEAGDSVSGARLAQVRQRRHGDTMLSVYRLIRPATQGVDDGDHRDLSG